MSRIGAALDFGLSNTQARSLAGKSWKVGASAYRFQDYDPAHRGQPPWKSGAEGKAFPLLGADAQIAAYLKFYNRTSRPRFQRALWLIGRQVHSWDPTLEAAPSDWADTATYGRPPGVGFDFGGCLGRGVPGMTWLEAKLAIAEGRLSLDGAFRRRCARDLLRALSALEAEGLIHGDLSPNNLIVHPAAAADRPAAYLIDFDAFAAPGETEALASLPVARGGSFGTEGYAPPDLFARYESGAEDAPVAPYSDRFGRDMLLIELLGYGPDLSPDHPPTRWSRTALGRAVREDGVPWQVPAPDLVGLPESDRPSSIVLAEGLGCSAASHPRPAPIVLKRSFPRVSPPPPPPPDDDAAWGNPFPPFGAVAPPANAAPAPPPPPPPPRKLWQKIVQSGLFWVVAAALLIWMGFKGYFAFNRLGSVALEGHTDTITDLAISADGAWGVSSSQDGTARVWDIRNEKESVCLDGHRGPVNAIAITADAGRVLTGGEDGTLRCWMRRSGGALSTIQAYDREGVAALAISADGRFAITIGTKELRVRRWDVERGVLLDDYTSLTRYHDVLLSADGRRAVFAGFVALHVWDFGIEREPHRLPGPHLDYRSVAIDADGARAVADGHSGRRRFNERSKAEEPTHALQMWDLSSKKLVARPGGEQDWWAGRLAMSADGSFLAASGDGGIHLLDVVSGKFVKTLPGGGRWNASSVALSADGRTLLYNEGKTGRVFHRPRP